MSSSDLAEETVAPASLTLTVANWNTPQIDLNTILYISQSLIFLTSVMGAIIFDRRNLQY